MFATLSSSGRDFVSRLVDTTEAISAAIAYASEMENICIQVSECAGMVFLEGTAPSVDAIERASEIAMDIAGPCVCNRIEPA